MAPLRAHTLDTETDTDAATPAATATAVSTQVAATTAVSPAPTAVSAPAATIAATATPRVASPSTATTLEPPFRTAIVAQHPTVETYAGLAMPALPTLTPEALAVLWPNPGVAQHAERVQRFLQGGRHPEHPLHQLLERYRAARLALDATQAQLRQLQGRIDAESNSVWSFDPMSSRGEAVCGDNARVSTAMEHEVAVFQPEAQTHLAQSLQEQRVGVFDEEAKLSYRSELARLAAEGLLARLLARCQTQHPPPLPALREAIDVLFYFVRAAGTAKADDRAFACEVQRWAKMALHTLVSLGSLEDHNFCLNHILRVRNGQGCDLAPFVRFPPCENWDDHLFQHVLAMLNTLLSPVPTFPGEELPDTDASPSRGDATSRDRDSHNRRREELDGTIFNSSIPAARVPSRQTSATAEWMVVSDDGVAINAKTYIHTLSDDDSIALLNQIPLASLLAYVFKVRGAPFRSGTEGYSAETVHRLFAFGRIYIRTLASVFHDPRRRHLRGFLKHVALAVVTCVRTMAEFLLQMQDYMRTSGHGLPYLPQVQAEYDAVLFDALVALEAAAVLEERSFQAMLPFDTASLRGAWHLLAFLHAGAGVATDAAVEAFRAAEASGNAIDAAHDAVTAAAAAASASVDALLGETPVAGWRAYLADPSARDRVAHRLVRAPFGAAQHLFTLFGRLVASRPRTGDVTQPLSVVLPPAEEASEEQAFISAVAAEVLFFSCVCHLTREECHRDGRDRLDEMAAAHPEIISLVVNFLAGHVEAIGAPGEYILNGLHLERWVPTRVDLGVLRSWLFKDLASLENRMALTLLRHLAWSVRLPDGDSASSASDEAAGEGGGDAASSSSTAARRDSTMSRSTAAASVSSASSLSSSAPVRADAPFGGHTLFLPKELQREAALLLLEAYAHHVPAAASGSDSGSGGGLVHWLAGSRARDAFVATCWQTLTQMQLWGPPHYVVREHARLWPLRGHAACDVAAFLTLAMTETAAGRQRFLRHGLPLLWRLSTASLHLAVVKVLFFATPQFAFGGADAAALLQGAADANPT